MKPTLIAVALTALLLLVPVASALSKPAYAQTTGTYGRLDQTARLNFSDGTSSTSIDQKYFAPADIAGVSGKTMTSLTIQLAAILPSSTDTITSSGVSMTARVLKPDGTYANVAFTPTISDYNVQKTTGGGYTLYLATIPVSAIQASIGTAPSNFQSEIRVTSGVNSAIFGTIGGQTRGFYTTQTVTVFSILVNPSSVTPGGVNNTGGGGTITPTPTDTPPHGKIYSVVSLQYTDGSSANGITGDNGGFNGVNVPAGKPFSVIAGTQTKPLAKVTYTLMMHLDNDIYSVAQQLQYQNQGATDNFRTTVDNVNINKVPNNVIQRQLSSQGGDYQLLSMDVSGQDLENAVKLTGQSTVQNGQQTLQYGFGTLSFYNRASSVTLTTSGKTYTVSVPEMTTTVDLQRSILSSNNGSCEINNGQCNPSSTPSLDMNTILIIGGAAGAGLAVVGYAKKRKK